MGKLIYAINNSLDGFTEDATGSFDWSVPDDEVQVFYNDMMRGVGTQLLGRRMYETMAVWETEPSFAEESAVLADFASAWQDSDKVVYSTTLTDAVTKRTRIVPVFDADEVRALKEASSADLLVGGPGLAAHASLGERVDFPRPWRDPKCGDARSDEHGIERAGELAGAVTDEEPESAGIRHPQELSRADA